MQCDANVSDGWPVAGGEVYIHRLPLERDILAWEGQVRHLRIAHVSKADPPYVALVMHGAFDGRLLRFDRRTGDSRRMGVVCWRAPPSVVRLESFPSPVPGLRGRE